jgi:signal transduction histidine kinase
MNLAGRSLRARLLRVGLIGGVLLSLFAAWLLGEAFRMIAERGQLRLLEQELAGIVGRLEARPDGSLGMRDRPGDPDYERVFSGRYWQAGDEGGYTSRSLWDFRASFRAGAGARAAVERIDGPAGQQLIALRQRVQVPRVRLPVDVWVAVDEAPLREDVRSFRGLTLIATALLFLLLAVLLAVQVRLGLRPLKRLASDVEQVRRGARARIGRDDLPAELGPLVGHLDELLEHHERSVQRARHAAADLAHALKTPLAALDAAAQRPGPELPRTVLEQSARMQATVTRQLQAGVARDFHARCEVATVATTLVELMRRIHAERGLRIEARIEPKLQLPYAEDDLQELLGNLLDNACKWARSQVHLNAGSSPATLWLQLDDDGPGLSEDAAAAARQRGVRLDERVPGSGLGLAIVEDLLDTTGGRLQLQRSPLGGLQARIEIDRAP